METRSIWTSTELNDYLDFPHVNQVCCIHRETLHLKTGKTTQQTVYGITSLRSENASPERLLQLNRQHWGIENSLHYVRDVTFDEDRSQIRTNHAPQVMAALRNVVISLFRWFKKNNIAKTLRDMAARPHLALKLLGL